jgi:gp32 DNA binding protein like
MDITKLKARLASLQNPRGKKEDQSQDFWKPGVDKYKVRIVPSKYDKSNPFKELFFHYEIGGKTMISPVNFNEKDPIVEFAQDLRKKGNWQDAKKIEPKMRIFAPVIVRGEEEKGVRLWGFGKQIYMELLRLSEDEEVGDYTDPVSGRDLVVEVEDKAKTGLNFNTTKVRLSINATPLSKDAKQVDAWLNNQPDPVGVFKRYTYEEIDLEFQRYLTGQSDAPEEKIVDDAEPVAQQQPQQKFSLNTSKKASDESFDDLFKLD